MLRQTAGLAPCASPIHASAATAAAPGEHRVTGAPAIPIAISGSRPSGMTTPTASIRVLRVRCVSTSAWSPCSRAVTAPDSSTITARNAPVRSTPSVSIVLVHAADVPLKLAPFERKRSRAFRTKELSIHLLQKATEPSLVGRREDHHASAFTGRKSAIVEVIAVERDERATELAREAVVFDVAGAAQLGVLEDEQHIPLEGVAHECHDTGRDIGVGIDARPTIRPFHEGSELGTECTHFQCSRGPIPLARAAGAYR